MRGDWRWVTGAEVTDITGLPAAADYDRTKCVLVSYSGLALQYTGNGCTPQAPYICDSAVRPTPGRQMVLVMANL